MKISNRSRVSTRALMQFVRFLSKNIKHFNKIDLLEFGNARYGYMSSGVAVLYRKGWKPVHPVKVHVSLSRENVQYPLVTQDAPYLPETLLRSWDEETLFVLAHEFRHVDQCWGKLLNFDDLYVRELDAELFAISMLRKWRRNSPA